MTRIDQWDTRGLELARLYASWSKDPSTKVGAYIADALHRPVSLGYNGFPQGVHDTQERLIDRPTRLKLTLHAEQNAILFAARPLVGCTLYVWPLPPCAHCAAMIIQTGIARVVAGIARPDAVERWADDLALAQQMFKEAGVAYKNI